MFALVQHDTVRQISESTFVVHPDYQWIECDNSVQIGDGWNGQVFVPQSVPEKPIDEVLREYQDALQNFLDKKASEKQYNSALSIATYVSSTNPQWKTEADAFIVWRDEVFVYALGVLNAVEQGGARPSIDDFLAGLPQLTWP